MFQTKRLHILRRPQRFGQHLIPARNLPTPLQTQRPPLLKHRSLRLITLGPRQTRTHGLLQVVLEEPFVLDPELFPLLTDAGDVAKVVGLGRVVDERALVVLGVDLPLRQATSTFQPGEDIGLRLRNDLEFPRGDLRVQRSGNNRLILRRVETTRRIDHPSARLEQLHRAQEDTQLQRMKGRSVPGRP